MNKKTAIVVLLIIFTLSVLTVLMFSLDKTLDNKVLTIEFFNKNKKGDTPAESFETDEDSFKENGYSFSYNSDIEKQKDEARARLQRLEELKLGIKN